MPKGSEELTNARKQEIIHACGLLYETMSFKEITMKEIGKATSFTRTSIYNYFHTKEEIFLALLQQEYELWCEDLTEIHTRYDKMSLEDFAKNLARTLESRKRLLKIISMNHYEMESHSRMENLAEFKGAYGNSIRCVTRCLEKFFPVMTGNDIQNFLYAFFPFLFGVYPYTMVTEKQKEAMEMANTKYVLLSVFEITYSIIKTLLQGF